MRRLHIDQLVTVSLDEVPRPIPCQVVAVQGSVSQLAPLAELPPQAVGRLALGGSSGYLLFNALRNAIGLRVAARATPPYLEVAVIDGVALPERRRGERVGLRTPARIVEPDADESDPVSGWTETINLSEQGALLRGPVSGAGQERFALELMFGDDPEPVAAQVRVVRRLQRAIGVTFESVSSPDAARLREYLAGARHQRSGRPQRTVESGEVDRV